MQRVYYGYQLWNHKAGREKKGEMAPKKGRREEDVGDVKVHQTAERVERKLFTQLTANVGCCTLLAARSKTHSS